MNNCNAVKLRGYDIKNHFQSKGNLLALDQANAHQSELRKKFKASDSVAVPDEFLKNLLVSESEKDHTIYLFQNGFSSMSLPDCDSVGFKCQQKTLPVPDMFKFVGPKPGKIIRISESTNDAVYDGMINQIISLLSRGFVSRLSLLRNSK